MTNFGKVALVYNAMAARKRERRLRQIEAVAQVLGQAGVAMEHVVTHGPGSAGEQARQAIRDGCDAVFACGGDGTVHEVLQGLVPGTIALGVIPMGTANSLATDLRIPRDPAAAARALLTAERVRLAAGRVEYCNGDGHIASRYFTVATGFGPDAHLFYLMSEAAKQRLGYAAYSLKALRVWATHGYPLFEVEWTSPGATAVNRERVSQLLAVRITNFGGILRRFAPGAALRRNDLRLVLFKTRSRLRFLRYMTEALLGREPAVRGIEFADAASVRCLPLDAAGARIRAEADGEPLGVLPATLAVVPDAITLLMPR